MRRQGKSHVSYVELAGAGFSDQELDGATLDKVLRVIKLGLERHTWQYKVGTVQPAVEKKVQPVSNEPVAKKEVLYEQVVVQSNPARKPIAHAVIFILSGLLLVGLHTLPHTLPSNLVGIGIGVSLFIAGLLFFLLS